MVISTGISRKKRKPFRYVLPINATPDQKRRFERDLSLFKNPKSKRAVYPDWTQSGEAVSYIVIPKEVGKDEKAIYAGIQVNTALTRFNETMHKS